MTDLILATFDWVPEMPRGYVARGTARPTFVKGRADQLAHFSVVD
ncbi:hypothetical protein HPA02_11500 [Bisbaumannia pacifica]|uniref:Uncharacterized protein n=1 Tax=Bisbaumannia pacifica TaxID=77098 RepID=A0A510X825_9GAMM|nr:hypothetical protein [Halomonas pacifica]GEK46867.1 hypothetical protein HPA02_11500 [Halomonas pacifica]